MYLYVFSMFSRPQYFRISQLYCNSNNTIERSSNGSTADIKTYLATSSAVMSSISESSETTTTYHTHAGSVIRYPHGGHITQHILLATHLCHQSPVVGTYSVRVSPNLRHTSALFILYYQNIMFNMVLSH